MAGNKDWSTPSLREVPFWKDGMSIDEYERERTYYYKHIDEVKKGTYKPLWKQKYKYDPPNLEGRSTKVI